MFRHILATILALALTTTFAIAEEQEGALSQQTLGARTLASLYLLSPQNPWHTYFIHKGEIPRVLYTVKQHLTTIDPSMGKQFEGEQLLDTILLAFAAYFRAHGGAGWENVRTHMETAWKHTEVFANEAEKMTP